MSRTRADAFAVREIARNRPQRRLPHGGLFHIVALLCAATAEEYFDVHPAPLVQSHGRRADSGRP